MSHLFVTQGDVTRTQCDAWILPTEAALGVTEAWHVALKARNIRFSGAALDHLPPDGWGDAGTRAFVIADARAEEPAVIAVNTGGAPGRSWRGTSPESRTLFGSPSPSERSASACPPWASVPVGSERPRAESWSMFFQPWRSPFESVR